MTLKQLLNNYENYIIKVFPKGRVNTPIKHKERYYNREVNDYVDYDSIKVLMVYVD